MAHKQITNRPIAAVLDRLVLEAGQAHWKPGGGENWLRWLLRKAYDAGVRRGRRLERIDQSQDRLRQMARRERQENERKMEGYRQVFEQL